ncbi:unnamed protein product [Brassica rapa subsp. narinosa]
MHHLGEFLAGKRADGPQEALRFSTLYSGSMASAAFIEPLHVIKFVAQLLRKDVLSKPLSDSGRTKDLLHHIIKKGLRGVKFEVTHRANVITKYRIASLTTQPTKELMFPVDENATMKSVIEYFQEMYGFTIQHTHLLCLQVGNQKKASYLHMEACKIVEGQRHTKRLNEKQITALLKVTCQRPRDRENDNLKLKYHENGKEKDCLPQVGQWNMMNKKVINGMGEQMGLC